MGLEDKYISIKEIKHKDKKIVLPRIVYIKESYIKEQDKGGIMKEVFNQLIKDPEFSFRLIEFMSKEEVSIPIECGTAWVGYAKED